MIGLVSIALAQPVPDAPGLALDAQVFRPSLDGARFSWVDEATPANPGPFFGLVAGYASDPLVYAVPGASIPVVRDLVGTDLSAGWGAGRFRVGGVLPIVARSTGLFGGETGIGDLALAGRVTVVHAPVVDLAVDGRLWVPTTSVRAPVGSRGLDGELAFVASARFDRVLLAVNTGWRAVPLRVLDSTVVDDVLTARVGLGLALGEVVGLSSELAGQMVARRPDPVTTPLELLVGGTVDPAGPIGWKLAVGRGLTGAMGSPSVRALVGVTYSSIARGPGDADRDGLSDVADRCPTAAEDLDRWQDTDGCPERTSVVASVTDEQGRPLPEALARLDGRGASHAFAGSVALELDPGAWTLGARAPGFADGLVATTIADGAPQTVTLVLHPQRVTVSRERVELDGLVGFETGSDRLLPDSRALLDEVAGILAETPQIRRLRIEGHTDGRGPAEDNRVLSELRAAAVRDHLVARGISSARLVSVGHGESRPLVEGEDEAALARNRRVEFFVELWEER